MKENTKKRKKARAGMEEALGKQEILNQMYEIYAKGKAGFDVYMKEMGRMMRSDVNSGHQIDHADILFS